jgi:hypothetical protein
MSFFLKQTTLKAPEKEKKEKKQSMLFAFLNDLYSGKKHILNEDNIGDYAPYIVNRFISGNLDTVLYAQEMNMRHALDPDMQYDYYYYSLPKKRRFSKWKKRAKEDDIELLRKFYNYNYQRAKEILTLHSEEDLEAIRKKMDEGGTK